MTKKTNKFRLKRGVVLKPYGVNSKITNDNLTDEIAILLIKNGKAKREDFIIKNTKLKNGNRKQ